MPLGNPVPGFGNAAEFQSSAIPYVTSSQSPLSGGFSRVDFPKVTRFVTIANRDASTAALQVGFTQHGLLRSGNYFTIMGGQVVTLELRVTSLFFTGATTLVPFSLCAGLTTIPAGFMGLLSGTLEDGTPGWSGVG